MWLVLCDFVLCTVYLGFDCVLVYCCSFSGGTGLLWVWKVGCLLLGGPCGGAALFVCMVCLCGRRWLCVAALGLGGC